MNNTPRDFRMPLSRGFTQVKSWDGSTVSSPTLGSLKIIIYPVDESLFFFFFLQIPCQVLPRYFQVLVVLAPKVGSTALFKIGFTNLLHSTSEPNGKFLGMAYIVSPSSQELPRWL